MKIVIFGLVSVLVITLLILSVFIIQWAWNTVMPVFNLPTITTVQAFALILLKLAFFGNYVKSTTKS